MNERQTTTVVAGDASSTVAEAAKKPKARSTPVGNRGPGPPEDKPLAD
jgi:hypothetical protein